MEVPTFARTKIAVTEFSTNLRCSLCDNIYRDPLTTGCGHHFCEECIYSFIETDSQCPTCKAFVYPKYVKKNTLLNTIVENLRTLMGLLGNFNGNSQGELMRDKAATSQCAMVASGTGMKSDLAPSKEDEKGGGEQEEEEEEGFTSPALTHTKKRRKSIHHKENNKNEGNEVVDVEETGKGVDGEKEEEEEEEEEEECELFDVSVRNKKRKGKAPLGLLLSTKANTPLKAIATPVLHEKGPLSSKEKHRFLPSSSSSRKSALSSSIGSKKKRGKEREPTMYDFLERVSSNASIKGDGFNAITWTTPELKAINDITRPSTVKTVIIPESQESTYQSGGTIVASSKLVLRPASRVEIGASHRKNEKVTNVRGRQEAESDRVVESSSPAALAMRLNFSELGQNSESPCTGSGGKSKLSDKPVSEDGLHGDKQSELSTKSKLQEAVVNQAATPEKFINECKDEMKLSVTKSYHSADSKRKGYDEDDVQLEGAEENKKSNPAVKRMGKEGIDDGIGMQVDVAVEETETEDEEEIEIIRNMASCTARDVEKASDVYGDNDETDLEEGDKSVVESIESVKSTGRDIIQVDVAVEDTDSDDTKSPARLGTTKTNPIDADTSCSVSARSRRLLKGAVIESGSPKVSSGSSLPELTVIMNGGKEDAGKSNQDEKRAERKAPEAIVSENNVSLVERSGSTSDTVTRPEANKKQKDKKCDKNVAKSSASPSKQASSTVCDGKEQVGLGPAKDSKANLNSMSPQKKKPIERAKESAHEKENIMNESGPAQSSSSAKYSSKRKSKRLSAHGLPIENHLPVSGNNAEKQSEKKTSKKKTKPRGRPAKSTKRMSEETEEMPTGRIRSPSFISMNKKLLKESHPSPLAAVHILKDSNSDEHTGTVLYNLDPKNCGRRNLKGETALHTSCVKGDFERLKSALNKSYFVNAVDNNQWAPLHEACNHGHSKCAELLLLHGADVDIKGPEGDRPIHDAVANGHLDCIAVLKRFGASVDGSPSLEDYARNVWQGSPDLCKKILEALETPICPDDISYMLKARERQVVPDKNGSQPKVSDWKPAIDEKGVEDCSTTSTENSKVRVSKKRKSSGANKQNKKVNKVKKTTYETKGATTWNGKKNQSSAIVEIGQIETTNQKSSKDDKGKKPVEEAGRGHKRAQSKAPGGERESKKAPVACFQQPSTKVNNLVIALTGLQEPQKNIVTKTVKELNSQSSSRKAVSNRHCRLSSSFVNAAGVKACENENQGRLSTSVTHLVCAGLASDRSKCRRTMKYCFGVVTGAWIVSYDWIVASREAGEWADEANFEFAGDSFGEGAPRQGRLQSADKPLFAGINFLFKGLFTPPLPSSKDLRLMINLGHGNIVSKLSPLMSKRAERTPFQNMSNENNVGEEWLQTGKALQNASVTLIVCDCVSFDDLKKEALALRKQILKDKMWTKYRKDIVAEKAIKNVSDSSMRGDAVDHNMVPIVVPNSKSSRTDGPHHPIVGAVCSSWLLSRISNYHGALESVWENLKPCCK
eukprot:Nk52_evm16s163 gene=Nk52_evmTU16s163